MQFTTLPKASSFHKFVRESPAYSAYVNLITRSPHASPASGGFIIDLEFTDITVPVDSEPHKAYLSLVDQFPEWFI